MTATLNIDFDWLDADFGEEQERVTYADLSIRIGEHSATVVEDTLARTNRDKIRVSAFDLAAWFASNWWRLRWEPERSGPSWEMSHKIAAAGGGYVWPDLTLVSDGESILIRSQRTNTGDAQLVRYLEDFAEVIAPRDFEHAVDLFVEGVIARLQTSCVQEPGLIGLWGDVCLERRDPAQTAWRKMEALLGFDPDEAPAELIHTLQHIAKRYGESAVEEIAAASSTHATQHIDQLTHAFRNCAIKLCVPSIKQVQHEPRKSDGPDHHPSSPAKAVNLARAARESWGIPSGPVSSAVLRDLFKIPSENWDAQPVSDSPMSAGLRHGEKANLSIHLSGELPTHRRFALARLVGDHLNVRQPEETLLPLTSAKTARQKLQHTFAQEFLCPRDDLLTFLDKQDAGDGNIADEQMDIAAAHFGISPLAVRSALATEL